MWMCKGAGVTEKAKEKDRKSAGSADRRAGRGLESVGGNKIRIRLRDESASGT